jgi:PAS domain S-box-containing protein
MHNQESPPPRLVEAIEQLQLHDHPCLIYETRAERLAVVAPFLRIGLERGERCLFLAPETGVESILEDLAAAGIDTADALARGTLFIPDIQSVYRRDEPFDPDRVLDFLNQAINDAKTAGFTNHRLIGEMTWILEGTTGTKRLIEYEAKLVDFLLSHDLPALCLYDRARFPPEVLLDVIRTHPKVIFGNVVSRNYSYLPPDEFFRSERPDIEVDRLLRGMLTNEELIIALEERNALLNAVVENSTDSIYVKDLQGRYLMINPAGAAFFGRNMEEVLGRDDSEIFSAESAEKICEADSRALTCGTPLTIEETITTAGVTRTYLTTKGAYCDAEGKVIGLFGIAREITERKRAEFERETTIEFLRLVNESASTRELIEVVVGFFQQKSGCEAAGVRLREGDDYPYFEARGFPQDFIKVENTLCTRDSAGEIVRDSTGNPVIECMCGNVICGRFDPSKPFFTSEGSFWTNSTTELLASTSEADRQARTRNRCHGEGYESVALIALRFGEEHLGLLQLNDRRTGLFTSEVITLWERLAGYLAVALAKFRAEEALQESEKRFRTLCDSAPIGIFRSDSEGNTIYCNPRWEEITGKSAPEGRGKGWIEAIHPDDRIELRKVWLEATATGRGYSHEHRYLTSQGRTIWVRGLANPIKSPDGKIFGYVGTLEDITELRLARQEMIKTQKLESLGILAGGIAHDFNNILTAILGNISLARLQLHDPEKATIRLKEAENATARAKDLTQQLLTFARGGEPVKKIIDVRGLMREAADFALHGSSVSCAFALADDLWPLEADEGQLSQVIHNLVLNAVQAMPEGGTVTISAANVSAAQTGKRFMKITVADTGGGIPEHHLRMIFDPYFTTKQQGSGLGLATSYSIIRKHGGKIRVTSTLGKGSTFHVSLPASEHAIEARPDSRTDVPHGSGSVLVMDDEEVVRDITEAILEQLGYAVECVKNGSEAIDLYRKRKEAGTPFAVVIMDLTIPGGMGGKEAITSLLETDPNVIAVVSSGYSTDPVMANYREYGFSAVLTKPYRLQEMSKVLQGLLQR